MCASLQVLKFNEFNFAYPYILPHVLRFCCSEGKPMLSQSQGYGALVGIRGRAWVMYTVFRVLFLAVAWLLIQVTTPIRGVWAIALAIVISAVFSILLLGRQRDAMSGSMFGFFRRINERIDAAAAKEDFDDLTVTQGEAQSESDSINEQEDPGRLENRD